MSKVLFINHTNDLFGAERALLKVAKASGLRPENVTFIEPAYLREDTFAPAVKAAGYGLRRMHYKNLGTSWWRSMLVLVYNLPAVWRVVRMVKCDKIDCIWSNTSLGCLGIVAARWAGVRHVWHIHEPAETDHDYVPELSGLYRRLFAYRRNTVVFVTRAQQQRWEMLYSEALKGKSRLIYTPADLYTRHRVADGVCRFGYIGSWSRRKNLVRLVEAFGDVHRHHPDTELVLTDNIGDDAQAVRQAIARLPEPQAVRILQVTNAQAFYDQIDVVVLPSLNETWGIVIPEAMQQGIATIVTEHTDLREIAQDGMQTLYIQPQNTRSIRNAMERMCDSNYRARIAKAGAEIIKNIDLNGQFVQQVQQLV